MKWDISGLEDKLNNISNELKKENNNIEKRVNKSLKNTILKKDENEINYFKVNEAYKKYISQYSKAYIEMSEYYYGPELPYNIYIKEFNNDKKSTYLDTSKDVIELYKLFIFYGLLENTFLKTIV
jgi:hypothetical protein|tara:strand:- start:108 stop:482 length:375 start_codon:yes stop_codon:yes gene_type:complete